MVPFDELCQSSQARVHQLSLKETCNLIEVNLFFDRVISLNLS